MTNYAVVDKRTDKTIGVFVTREEAQKCANDYNQANPYFMSKNFYGAMNRAYVICLRPLEYKNRKAREKEKLNGITSI